MLQKGIAVHRNVVVAAAGNPRPLQARGRPTGGVTFFFGSTSLGNASLASGAATFTVKLWPVGVQTITATYSADKNYATSSSLAGSLDIAFTSTIGIAVADAAGDTITAQLALKVQYEHK
jgi:hypothetical protein